MEIKRLSNSRGSINSINFNLIDNTFNEYCDFRNDIEKGFLNKQTYDWLVDKFDLIDKCPKVISDLWFDIDKYFTDLMLDETGNSWRNDVSIDDWSFVWDTHSAWFETLNNFSRKRRGEYSVF